MCVCHYMCKRACVICIRDVTLKSIPRELIVHEEFLKPGHVTYGFREHAQPTAAQVQVFQSVQVGELRGYRTERVDGQVQHFYVL